MHIQGWQFFASRWKKRFLSTEKNRCGKNSFCHLNLRLLFFDKRLVHSYYIQLWFHLFFSYQVCPTYLFAHKEYV